MADRSLYISPDDEERHREAVRSILPPDDDRFPDYEYSNVEVLNQMMSVVTNFLTFDSSIV